MAGILDALKIIKEQLPKFTQEMGVPFLGKDKPSSVTDKVDPNLEKKALETLLPMLVMGAGIAPAAMKATNLAFKYPKIAGAGVAAATGDPSAAIVNPVLSLALGANDAEAAFITPRSALAKLTKFADASLEQIPNPKGLGLEDLDYTTLHKLYSKTPEGREILRAVPSLPDAEIVLGTSLPPSSRGRLTSTPSGQYRIDINAFPKAGKYDPEETLYHEVQHLIDAIQGRASGTNLSTAESFLSDLKSSDLLKHMTSDSTISKETAASIMKQRNYDAYIRHTGEYRARLDAGQDPLVDIRDTWHFDPATDKFVTFPKE